MTDRSLPTPPVPPATPIAQVQNVAERIVQSVGQVIYGKRNEIRLTVLSLLAQGHILLEDIPGVGKTTLAKALARSMGLHFSRIQFTPDLQPSAVTGTSIYNEATRQFEFHPGPVFAQIVLADEINRATPKTQSALLEAMEEYQVTVDGTTYPMQQPFLIMATQNPIDYEGTYPLPEAQLDRFLVRIQLGYPSPAEELVVLSSQQYDHPLNNVRQVVPPQELISAQRAVRDVYAAEEIKRYIIDLVNATRRHPQVYLGASPRGSLALFRAAQTRAAMAGRDYILPDDVKALGEVTLAHRIITHDRDVNTRQIVQDILNTTPIPGAATR
ncbi:MAG: MoxR family ATPase [Anaerolineae bacterium]|jgi:MoxR-like ATPase|nr:MoxR family ATPase [Anaerolineae bacterium]